MRQQKNQGFTLVEIGIVLIIIGLIIGGVLAGRDLIRTAEIRAQVKQIEQLNTAMGTFRTKYNCIPGDCASAVAQGLGTSGGDGDNGDGSGAIESTTVTALDSSEIKNYWIHLSNSKLISWTGIAGTTVGTNSPPLAYKGAPMSGTSGFWLAETPQVSVRLPAKMSGWRMTAASGSASGIYMPADAYALDVKMDDGYPDSGIVGATGDYNSVACSGVCIFVIPPSSGDFGLGVTCLNDNASPTTYDLTTVVRTSNALCELTVRWAN